MGNSRFNKNVAVGTVAADCHNVMNVGYLVDDGRIVVNGNKIMTFVSKVFKYGSADFSAAYNNDIHSQHHFLRIVLSSDPLHRI